MGNLPKEILAEKENVDKALSNLNEAMARTEKSVIGLWLLFCIGKDFSMSPPKVQKINYSMGTLGSTVRAVYPDYTQYILGKSLNLGISLTECN